MAIAHTRSGEPAATVSLLTTTQTALILGKSVRTVHRMVGAGRLQAVRVPGYKGPLLFDPDHVERVREELNDEPSPAAQAS